MNSSVSKTRRHAAADRLGFIANELKLAADSLQGLALQDWGIIGSADEERQRNRFRSLFNLITDKAHDLEAVHTFAYETLANDPVVLQRVQGEMQIAMPGAEQEDHASVETVN